ncbi:MAG: hypothetical protein U0T36_06415 [Saprospiraceae bacterium]
MTVSVSGGGSVSYPVSSLPATYSITGLNADGVSHTVTATFSDDASCTNTAIYTAPIACGSNPCPNPNCVPVTVQKLVMKTYTIYLLSVLFSVSITAQIDFIDASSFLPQNGTFYSWMQKGACDMNNDRLDDIVRSTTTGNFYLLTQQKCPPPFCRNLFRKVPTCISIEHHLR